MELLEIRRDGPADRAELKRMDIILTADNEPVTEPRDLQRIVRRHLPDDGPDRKILYEDPELGFCILGHVNQGAKQSPPHDHGPTWAIYGQAVGETIMTDWALVSPASEAQPGKVRYVRDYKLTPGAAYVYNEGDLHSPRRDASTKLIRIEGEVQHAGIYSAQPGETLRQVIERAGGLTTGAYLFGAQLTRESARIVKMANGVLISETRHGFVCANAGVDASNVGGHDVLCLLPPDPDASAERIRAALREGLGVEVAVIISDTFGRPWRESLTNVAIGVAGMAPIRDYVGLTDAHGSELRVTTLADADELAGAAELVMGKIAAVPVAIVRGFVYTPAQGSARELVRAPGRDLFR